MTEVIIGGHLVSSNELPKMPLRTYNLLVVNDWTPLAGYAKFKTDTVEYGPKAAKAGEVRGGEVVEMNWIQAHKGDEKIIATWHDGSFVDAIYRGRLVKSTELSRIIKGEI